MGVARLVGHREAPGVGCLAGRVGDEHRPGARVIAVVEGEAQLAAGDEAVRLIRIGVALRIPDLCKVLQASVEIASARQIPVTHVLSIAYTHRSALRRSHAGSAQCGDGRCGNARRRSAARSSCADSVPGNGLHWCIWSYWYPREFSAAARAKVAARKILAGRDFEGKKQSVRWVTEIEAPLRTYIFLIGVPRPPGSSRRAGGHSPVFRLGYLGAASGEKPCPQK